MNKKSVLAALNAIAAADEDANTDGVARYLEEQGVNHNMQAVLVERARAGSCEVHLGMLNQQLALIGAEEETENAEPESTDPAAGETPAGSDPESDPPPAG